jgi:hypothetical protein
MALGKYAVDYEMRVDYYRLRKGPINDVTMKDGQ